MAAVATQYNKQVLGGSIRIGASLRSYDSENNLTLEDAIGNDIAQLGEGIFFINPSITLELGGDSAFLAGGTVSFTSLPTSATGATGTVWSNAGSLEINTTNRAKKLTMVVSQAPGATGSLTMKVINNTFGATVSTSGDAGVYSFDCSAFSVGASGDYDKVWMENMVTSNTTFNSPYIPVYLPEITGAGPGIVGYYSLQLNETGLGDFSIIMFVYGPSGPIGPTWTDNLAHFNDVFGDGSFTATLRLPELIVYP